MGFYEDDRIRRKNRAYNQGTTEQELIDKSRVTLDKTEETKMMVLDLTDMDLSDFTDIMNKSGYKVKLMNHAATSFSIVKIYKSESE